MKKIFIFYLFAFLSCSTNQVSQANIPIDNKISLNDNKALATFQQWYDSNLKALDELEHTIYTEYTFSNVVTSAIVKQIVEEINSSYGDAFNQRLKDDLNYDIYPLTSIISDLKLDVFSFKSNSNEKELENFIQKYSIEHKPRLDKIILKFVDFNTTTNQSFNRRLEYKNCKSNYLVQLPVLDKRLGIKGNVQAHLVKNTSNTVDLIGISIIIDKANLCHIDCDFDFEYDAYNEPQAPKGVETYKLRIDKNSKLSESDKSSSSTYSEFYLDMRTENNKFYIRIRKNSQYFEYAEEEISLDRI